MSHLDRNEFSHVSILLCVCLWIAFAVLGDIFVLIGCVFYAVSNLGQEYLVKSFDRFEFLGMLGLCGSIISAVQMAILERDALAQVQFSGHNTKSKWHVRVGMYTELAKVILTFF